MVSGLVRWTVALSNGQWPCEMASGPVRRSAALLDGRRPCEMVSSHVRWLVALTDGQWPCQVVGGPIRWSLAPSAAPADRRPVPSACCSRAHGPARPAAAVLLLPLQPVHVGGLPARRGAHRQVGPDGA